MAKLKQSERKRLHAALVQAFPNRAALDELLSLYVGENLASIAAETSALPDAMLKVIQWFEARGRITDLVAAAHEARSGNDALTTITREI
jgi:hypothetical protein